MKQILKNTLIVLFLGLFVNECFAQDRIIMNSGDTIHCTISKVTKKHLHFHQDYSGVSAKGKILKSNISEWNYFIAKDESQPMFPATKPHVMDSEEETDIVPHNRQSGRIRISLNGGPAYLVGNTENAEQTIQEKGVSAGDAKSYYNNLKLGYQAKSSAYYYLTGNYWLGAMYHGFYSTTEIITPMVMDDDYMYYGKLGERFFVNFAGASFFSANQYGQSKQIGVSSSFAIGPAFYRDELDMLNEQILIQGIALATNLTLGLEYFIRPNISLSLESSLFSSQAKKLTVKTATSSEEIKLEKENYENLSRLDLSLGIIWYW